MFRHGTTGIWAWVVCGLVIVYPADGQAGRWQTRGNISLVTENYFLGNVFLDNTGAREQEKEFVLRLRPRFNATRRGSRASVNISYVPEFSYFLKNTQPNEITHFLNATGDVELIERRLGIRATAKAGQQVIDPNRAASESGLVNPDNITDTYSFSINPYLLPIRFGRFAVLNISTDIGYVINQDAEDSQASRAGFNLLSGPRFDRLRWRFSTERTFISSEDDNESTFSFYELGLSYGITRRLFADASIGKDNNTVDTARDINGLRWRLGFNYVPNSRINLNFGYGQRYNTQDFDLALNYRHRRSTFRASYNRVLQTANDAFLARDLFPGEDAEGNVIDDPTQDEGSLTALPGGPVLDGTVSIVDSLNVSFSSSYRRTSYGIDTQYFRRDNLQRSDVTKDYIVRLNIRRRLTPKSSLGASVLLQTHSDDSGNINDYDQWSGNLGYAYRFSKNWSLSVAYNLDIREGNDPLQDFSEDRISVNLISNYDTQNR